MFWVVSEEVNKAVCDFELCTLSSRIFICGRDKVTSAHFSPMTRRKVSLCSAREMPCAISPRLSTSRTPT